MRHVNRPARTAWLRNSESRFWLGGGRRVRGGGTVTAFNVIVVVIFLCGIETHVDSWTQAVRHAGYLLAGGMWAALISLFLWPVHPYRPARIAVAKCYGGLTSMLASTLSLMGREEAPHEVWLCRNLALNRAVVIPIDRLGQEPDYSLA